MTNILTFLGVPIGTAIAGMADPDALEKLADFSERHTGFCMAVGALWLGRSAFQWWVMQSHQSNAVKAAELAVINRLGGLDEIIRAGTQTVPDSQTNFDGKLNG